MRINWRSRNKIVSAITIAFITPVLAAALTVNKYHHIPDDRAKFTHITPVEAAPAGANINKYQHIPDYRILFTHITPVEVSSVEPVEIIDVGSRGSGLTYHDRVVYQDQPHKIYKDKPGLEQQLLEEDILIVNLIIEMVTKNII